MQKGSHFIKNQAGANLWDKADTQCSTEGRVKLSSCLNLFLTNEKKTVLQLPVPPQSPMRSCGSRGRIILPMLRQNEIHGSGLI